MKKREQFDQYVVELRLTYAQLDDPDEAERIWQKLGYAPTEEVDDEDEDLKYEIMGFLTLPKFVTPQCCEDCQTYKTIFLVVDSSYYDGKTDTPPKWMVRCRSEKFDCEASREAKCCPHCGAPVPEIEPSGITKRICKSSSGGDYCDTCGERGRCCTCLPAEFAWKVKGT